MIENIGDWQRTHYSKQVKPEMGNEEVIVMGWVRELRDLGKLKFIKLADREGFIQVTAKEGDVKPDIINKIEGLGREDVIAVKGIVKASKQAPNGIEIMPVDVRILNTSDSPLPLELETKKTPAHIDTRMNWRFLDLRKHENNLIFKIQTAMEMAMREFWIKNGFIEIHSPKLMGSQSETGAELFTVVYFDREAYLAQSPQFYKQLAMIAGFDRVFEIAPVFRANPSHTVRHDTEYTSIDMEMSWISSHEDVMAFEEKWITYVIEQVKKQYGDKIKETFGFELVVPKIPFPRMTLKEAKDKIKKTGKKVSYKEDLSPEEERLLGELVKEESGHEFVFVTEFPWKIKPFYHMRDEKNPGVTKGFDLLWKGLEVTTGSQREHRYDVLVEQAKEKKLKLDSIKSYLDFFRYGAPPHGGLGFGLTRALMTMFEMKNVREVTFAFRDMDRLYP
ncbi:MAG: aspartate--tRNA(Asn) ligase [Candidatus Aenigmatarchaeota archaeon]